MPAGVDHDSLVTEGVRLASVALVSQSRGICYVDLILDQSSGIVLRPLSLLGSDVGLKTLVSLTTALSLQYEKCWIVLYAQDEKRCGMTLAM